MWQMDTWEHSWMVLLIVLVGGLVVGKLTERPKIPDVAAYLVFGILIGPAVLNWVAEPGQSEVNQFILNLGATLIVFDGGRSISLAVLKRVWISIVLLATLGVLVSTVVVGGAVHLFAGGSWLYALLLASVIASTDPATLMPVFKRVRIQPLLQQTVESESAFNDATASVLVFTLLDFTTQAASGTSTHASGFGPVLQFLQSAGIGLTVGLVVGLLALWLVSLKGWGVFHEFGSIVLLAAALGAWQVSEAMGASGLMAAFVAGIVTGNGKAFGWPLEDHTEANIHHFGNAVTLILRMLIFVLLGTQVDFHVVQQNLGLGLLVVAVLMFVARPLTVLSSVLWDRKAKWQARDIWFMFWVRETGVIPAALSGMLLANHVAGADVIAAVTFLAILATILVQASTTGFVAKLLGVAVPTAEEEDV